MIRIGDFSKLSRVPVKTLRYYDEMGLLNPVSVDPVTGYRLYEYSQLSIINRILALKDLGFSLEEIGRLLDDDLSAEQIRGMLKLRETETRQRVREEAERLQRVEARLRQIEQENTMSRYDVVIKRVDAMKVASVRDVVPTPPDQGRLWRELEGCLAMNHVRASAPCLSLYHDDEYKERDWDIEVCEPITTDVKESARVKVRELPAEETMACVIHHGPFTAIGEAYDAVMKWIAGNGYQIAGPAREVYVREAKNGSQTDPNTVTEVQFPVKKA
ncbi:MAG: MerR family transcriptional regulator [Anaerolineaceae bacterium]|nr:MAG: MerR family transcriptional regulator [Anaerolineaceae bacterium]